MLLNGLIFISELDKIFYMKRAAHSFLLLILICCVVLTAPGGLLAGVGVPAPGCCQCQMAVQAAGQCPCCQHHGKPNHCGASGCESNLNGRCNSDNPASIATAGIGAPSWQVMAHVPALIKVASKSFAPNIFHPPEFLKFSLSRAIFL